MTAYVMPEYVYAFVPAPATGGNNTFLTCTFCAAVVFDANTHSMWHAHLWAALSGDLDASS